MRRQTLATITLILLFVSVFLTTASHVKATPQASLVSDAFFAPDVPRGHNSTIVPGYYETSEYLIGSVTVGIILPESVGGAYDWTETEISQTVTGIKDAMAWWASQEPKANLSFSFDMHVQVPTVYEPIQMYEGEDVIWIEDVMSHLNYTLGSPWDKVRAYNNDIREAFGTDWAFAIFVVDSDWVNMGRFKGGGYAHAYLGGPWVTMSRFSAWAWNSPNYHIAVPAHEMGHIFYATDEYNSVREYSGYLDASDNDGAYGIMNRNSFFVSASTRLQVGWRDTDSDGILDIVDTSPKTVLSFDSSDLDENTVSVTYNGSVTEVPYPNRNPFGTGRDLTINTITNVEIKLDNGTWSEATAADGVFDEAEEMISFSSNLSVGIHVLNTRAGNSMGNAEVSYLSHEVGEVSASTVFRIPRDDSVTVNVDKTTFKVIATNPHIIKPAINVTNKDVSREMNSITAFYFIPFDWGLDMTSVQVRLVRGGRDVKTLRKEYCFTTFASNVLVVDIPDVRAAVGDSLSYGDSVIITFKLSYSLRNATLSDDYAWSDVGPAYHFAFASESLKTKLKWVLGPPWVWKRP